MPNNNYRLRTFYIYEITYNVDGRTYIGQRHCPINLTPETDTRYMGGGNHIKAAEKKYGINKFSKRIIAVCHTQEILDILETEYIRLYKEIGKAEFNIAPGGLGGNGNWLYLSEKRQQEIRRKISKANKGKVISQKQRDIISNKLKERPSSRKGAKASEETLIKQSISQKKRYENPEERKRTGNAVKNSKKYQNAIKSEEHRRKMSELSRGRVMSEESRKKMSEKAKGRKWTPEMRKKMIEILVGRKFSDEHKKHLSDSLIGKNKGKLSNTRWYNNGKENYRGIECPPGFVLGRINFNNVGNKGMKWWNNGIIQVQSFKCPEGFARGKLPMKEETKEKLRQFNLNKVKKLNK